MWRLYQQAYSKRMVSTVSLDAWFVARPSCYCRQEAEVGEVVDRNREGAEAEVAQKLPKQVEGAEGAAAEERVLICLQCVPLEVEVEEAVEAVEEQE